MVQETVGAHLVQIAIKEIYGHGMGCWLAMHNEIENICTWDRIQGPDGHSLVRNGR